MTYSNGSQASSLCCVVPCHYWTGVVGSCRFGETCRFLHHEPELYLDSCDLMPPAREEVAAAVDAGTRVRNAGQLNPLAVEFVPSSPSRICTGIARVDQETSDAFDCTGGNVNRAAVDGVSEQYSYVSFPVHGSQAGTLIHCLDSVREDINLSGGQVYYDWETQSVVVMGTPEQQEVASVLVFKVVEEVHQRHNAECCVCLEAPRKRDSANNARPVYGLLEHCDHIVCLPCIMAWRQNSEASRQARLGCPVCRTLSYIIVPWPESVIGDEKVAVVAQHKERCKVTRCKWSSNGQRCPAGKHCMYDHSRAPQIIERIRRQRFGEPADSSDDDDDLITFLAMELFEGGRDVDGLRMRMRQWVLDSSSEDDSGVETDDETSAALAQMIRARTRRFTPG